ncbi:MAG: hypothetical protein Q7R31_02550 [Candidatus Levybacteria bacterium]|nr:hypothetical protein [Candidatus Levybacteria bacterium]
MKIFKPYFLIIFLSIFPIVPIFLTTLLPHTHDGLVHLARIAAYFKALSDGQIPVRWAGDLNYGYGMPLFNFMYQLPYLISSFFVFLGFGLAVSFKITLALSFILAGIFMLGFSKAFFGDYKRAFAVTIFYQYMPFRLIEVLIRGSFGEVYTYVFLPLILWGLTLIFKKISYKYIVVTSLATALLVISHNAISLVFFGICTAFIIFFGKNIRNYAAGTTSLSLGLLLSSFYWVPALLERKYTYGDLFMKNVYLSHFPPIQNFFIPNLFNNIGFQTGGISVQFGLFHTIVFVVSLFALFSFKKIEPKLKKLLIFSLLIFAISLFMMQPISSPIWANVALLRQFQFPWRFLSVSGFALSLLSVFIFRYKFFLKNSVYVSLLSLVIFSTIYYWKPQLGLDKINENYYWNFPLNTTYFGETDVIWSKGPAENYPKQRVELIGGDGEIFNFKKKSNLQTLSVNAKTKIQLVDHTQYFPGWRVYVDGIPASIEFQDQNWRGQITFVVPKGQHMIKAVFGESRVRLIADILSVLSLTSLVLFGFLRKVTKII